MNTFLKFTILFIFSGIFLFSCIKKPTRKEVEENLKTAMELNLNQAPNVDTSLLKFKVLSVVFFEDKMYYECEYRVNMKQKLPDRSIDTTGIMNARVSKDFKTVSRKG